MPTLVEEPTSVPSMESSALADPSELTLTVGGVTFSLTPSSNDAGISYKRSGQEIVLSLSSFSGSLKVCLKNDDVVTSKNDVVTSVDSPEQKTPTATVEVESPVLPKAQKAKRGNTSQTKLTFAKKTFTKKTNEERKRTVELVTPSTVVKKRSKTISDEPTTLGQAEEPTQEATQTQPDLSQTMSSQTGDDDEAMASRLSQQQQERTQSSGSSEPRCTSVQDILDRSNDDESVATLPMDDDGSVSAEKTRHHADESEEETKMEEDNALADTKEGTTESLSQDTPIRPSPCPRWGHTMTELGGDKVLVYGGQSFDLQGNPVILDDVHVYDMDKGLWNKPIQCRGDKCQWHSATYLPERQLVITFGGETVDPVKNKVITSNSLKALDTDIMLWYPPAVSGDIPTGRSGHTMTLLPNTNELVLFGGVKGARWLNTVSVLDTVRWVWTAPKVEGMLLCRDQKIIEDYFSLTIAFFRFRTGAKAPLLSLDNRGKGQGRYLQACNYWW